MIDVIIKMKVPVDQNNEILPSIKYLLVPIRHEQDCVSSRCYLDTRKNDVVIFEQQWKTNETLATHLRSGQFKVLLESMKQLAIVRGNTVLGTGDLESLMASRESITTRNTA
jgi:quinol monooxygenase YgiN